MKLRKKIDEFDRKNLSTQLHAKPRFKMKPCDSCLDVVPSTLLVQRQHDRSVKKFEDEIENK
jgi:hypothetical protein